MLEYEIFPGSVTCCAECDPKECVYRCMHCFGAVRQSKTCIVKNHSYLPTHDIRVSVSIGNMYNADIQLASVGLGLTLNGTRSSTLAFAFTSTIKADHARSRTLPESFSPWSTSQASGTSTSCSATVARTCRVTQNASSSCATAGFLQLGRNPGRRLPTICSSRTTYVSRFLFVFETNHSL
jgi:hypothetical protein